MNAIATIPTRFAMPAVLEAEGINARKWRVLCETTFPSAKTPEAIVMALDYCQARGLDVFKKPVHIVPMWNTALGKEVETVWPGINEIQITAARTGQWAGMDEPRWGPEREVTLSGHRYEGRQKVAATIKITVPEWCAVTVYRMIGGQRCPFTEPVFWLEAYSRAGGKGSDLPTDMWMKRPRGQLHKVAKAAALRAAFPEEGEHTAEEMEGKEIEAGGVVIDASRALTPPSPEPVAAPQITPPSASAPSPEHGENAFDRIMREIAAAKTSADLDASSKDNGADFRKLPQDQREKVMAAANARYDALEAQKPEQPAPPSAQSESLASRDPEAWIADCDARMADCADIETLRELWECVIAPESEDAFPPDIEEVRKAFARHEARLADA